jgi:hypothetical protein
MGLALTLVVAAVELWPRGPRPCRATFEQVRDGMAREEVIATVGGPPGDYTSRGISLLDDNPQNTLWVANDAVLIVTFGPDERVVEATIGSPISQAPWWAEMRDWLGI